MSQYKFVSVALGDIFLDNDNPRHDPIAAEPEIIQKLIADEKVMQIAASLAERGTSPLKRMAVIRHPSQSKKFTVVEGNRRLCALKLLRDPKRAPTAASRRFFEGLKGTGQAIPTKVEVVLFPDRDSARYWLSLEHEGEQDGVGTRNWKANEKARFNAQGSPTINPNAQALNLLDYAQKSGLISDAERKALSITTITRYLSNPVVRSTFGLTNNKDLTIDVPDSEFQAVVTRFLRDAAEGKTVNSRTNSEDRKKYAVGLQKKGETPQTRLSVPVVATAKAATTSNKVARNSRHPDKRSTIVPTDFKLQTKDSVLRRIFEELRTINPDFSFAGGYLLRAFVEKLAHEFLRSRGVGVNGKKLHEVIGSCCTELKKDGISDRQLKPLSAMTSNRDASTSPDTLGAWVHGSLIPTATALKARWDELSPGLMLMVQRLK